MLTCAVYHKAGIRLRYLFGRDGGPHLQVYFNNCFEPCRAAQAQSSAFLKETTHFTPWRTPPMPHNHMYRPKVSKACAHQPVSGSCYVRLMYTSNRTFQRCVCSTGTGCHVSQLLCDSYSGADHVTMGSVPLSVPACGLLKLISDAFARLRHCEYPVRYSAYADNAAGEDPCRCSCCKVPLASLEASWEPDYEICHDCFLNKPAARLFWTAEWTSSMTSQAQVCDSQ